MGDRYNIHSQLEHLQSKYVGKFIELQKKFKNCFLFRIGTGHADTSKWDWATNIHRDTFASYLGHFDMLNHIALCENESKARVKFQLIKRMIQPCGPPHEKMDES